MNFASYCNTIYLLLDFTHCQIGSQCSSLRIRVTWSYFLPPVTNLAATFCTHWTRLICLSCAPYRRALAYSSQELIKACVAVCVASLSRYFLIALQSLNWGKAVLHRLSAWEAMLSSLSKLIPRFLIWSLILSSTSPMVMESNCILASCCLVPIRTCLHYS